MTDYLIRHLDFIYLLYGSIFFLLALTAGAMARRGTSGENWRFLCAFGIVHGLGEWTDIVFSLLAGSNLSLTLRGVILGGSFFCLFEFGRRNIVWNRRWKAGPWIYLPGLIIILQGVLRDPSDFLALIRYNLGFPAGLLASLAVWRAIIVQSEGVKRWSNILPPLALILYTLSASLFGPGASFWPASSINDQWFLATFGLPVQVLRSLLAGFFALALSWEYAHWRGQNLPADFTRRLRLVKLVSVAAISFVLVAGWLLAERAEQESRKEHTRRLSSLCRGMAAVLSAQKIQDLKGVPEDATIPAYVSLNKDCQRICEADPDIRYVYLTALRDGKMVFLVDTEPVQFIGDLDKPNASPGDVYQSAPSELVGVFKAGMTVVSKPYQDEWGVFVSCFSPIVDAEGNIIAVLGIDEQAAKLQSEIAYARLLRLLLTAGAFLLLLIFATLWRREIEESQIRNTNGQRMQIQQAALLRIANSSFLAEGNIFMMARAVTTAVAEVIGIDRVELWLKIKSQDQFRAEDAYHAGRGIHASGAISHLAKGDPFLRLLGEGRVAPSFDFQSDGRFRSIREEAGADARSVLVAPLRVSGRLDGWLMAVQSLRCRKWLADEMRFVAEMADQISHALINNERKLAEDELRKAHAELEIRVRERTEALSHKNHELIREINERLRVEHKQRALQDKMLQTQKLESLGLMAGGIAHDFNNILMAVLGNVELARLETPPDSPIYDYLQDIDKASCRAAELARQMLIYSGRGHASVQAIDLNEMITDMTSMLKVSLGRKVQLVYELDTGIPPVDGDLTQLRQVLMNLVINASEAIGQEGGSITLRTGVAFYEKALFASMWLKEDLPEGSYVFMDVVDNGCGMDDGTVQRIFDPFFTTKFTGRGLGLAAVLGIVKGHHGTIDVISQVGAGTHFKVILPIGISMKDGKGEASSEGGESTWRGEGTVLLADDEEAVRILGRRMLERIGFTVLTANGGGEAIDIYKQHRGLIRCVLLDLTMPDLDGKETLDGIRAIDPLAKIIMCSGYNEENIYGDFSSRKVSGFLQKPYKLENLMNLLRVTLCAG